MDLSSTTAGRSFDKASVLALSYICTLHLHWAVEGVDFKESLSLMLRRAHTDADLHLLNRVSTQTPVDALAFSVCRYVQVLLPLRRPFSKRHTVSLGSCAILENKVSHGSRAKWSSHPDRGSVRSNATLEAMSSL